MQVKLINENVIMLCLAEGGLQEYAVLKSTPYLSVQNQPVMQLNSKTWYVFSY